MKQKVYSVVGTVTTVAVKRKDQCRHFKSIKLSKIAFTVM